MHDITRHKYITKMVDTNTVYMQSKYKDGAVSISNETLFA